MSLYIKYLTLWLSIIAFLLVIPSFVLGDQDVEGDVYGEWTADESPYYVVGTVTVPEDEELFINPGVDVIFNDHYAINVEGTLIADGGEERILFEGEDTSWDGIYFRRRGDYSSSIRNCDLVNVRAGISCSHNSPQIIGNTIDARHVSISCVGASPQITGNSLTTYGDNISLEIYGISLRDNSQPRIEKNILIKAHSQSSGSATGILVSESDPLIRDNEMIEAVSDIGLVKGILAYRVDKLTVKRNVIQLQSQGEMRGLWTTETTEVQFINNNVLLNGPSKSAIGLLIGDGSEVTVINNIVIGNANTSGRSIGIDLNEGTLHEASGYNDFWNHYVNYIGNYDGDLDIHADPLFDEQHESPYHLAWPSYPDFDERRSPCIDAGDPNLVDDDGTRSDIGCYPYIHPNSERGSLRPASQFKLISAYPNPFNSSTKLSFSLDSPANVQLAVYNSAGRQLEVVNSEYMKAGAHSVLWDGSTYPSGVYLFTLNAGESFSSKKVALIR